MPSGVKPQISVGILIVDDDPGARTALRAVLESPNYELIEASSGEEALRLLLTRDFAVMLVDLVMPGMSGLELATMVKKRPRSAGMPILFLTGRMAADDELVEKVYRAGGVDFLTKPLVPTVVRAKVATLAELVRQRLQLEFQAESLRRADEKERELALRELGLMSERRFRSLADAVPNIVWTTNPEGIIDYYNLRWFEFSGFSAGEGPRSWFSLVDPDDRERCLSDWRRSLETGSPFQGEYRLAGGDGKRRWFLARALPERGQSGAVIAWLGTLTDITEQKFAERERERLYRKAVAALEARDDFVSEASHELRTPVTSLGLLLESLQRKLERGEVSSEQLGEKIATAARQVEKLKGLIGELLDVSRMKGGPLVLELEPVDLGELAGEVVSRFSEDAAQSGSPLSLDARWQVKGKWDRLRLDQAITNLISNALKFGKGKRIEISVGVSQGHAILQVRDHGIGIAEEDLDRIFERFERTTEARAFGGMGLGLYIVRQIMEAHGGSLKVESTLGDGSCFSLHLPLRSGVV